MSLYIWMWEPELGMGVSISFLSFQNVLAFQNSELAHDIGEVLYKINK